MFNNERNIRLVKLISFGGISLLIVLLNASHSFFWDTISQVSKPANWYYGNNFKYFFVPDQIATGHPTFIGMYLALMWNLFGKSLLVSHLSMLPFIFGIFYQLDSYLKNSGEKLPINLLIILIVACDATLLSQMSMVTFDIPQVFFFLWCINSLMKENYKTLSLSFTFLVVASLRGTIIGAGVVLYVILIRLYNKKDFFFKGLWAFIPGIISIVAFLYVFYFEKHWIIHNTVSNNWKRSAEFASLHEIIWNILIVGWRLVDYGRIGIWVLFLIILLIALKRRTLFDSFWANSFFIALCQFLVIFPVVIIYRNPFGHRYFLPVIIFTAISSVYWLIKYSKLRFFLYGLILVIVIGGHFLVYPERIPQGWDGTTAHWPYFSLRREMLGYLDNRKIPVETIGSFFPNLAPMESTDITGSKIAFKEADLKNDEYILYSNVYNLEYDLISELNSGKNWIEEKRFEKRGVYLILFKRIK
jgi:hypothetical protein